MTNRDRVLLLKDRIRLLGLEVKRQGLSVAYTEFAARISSGAESFQPVDEEEWDVMLDVERNTQLLAYYHTARAELQQLTEELKKTGSDRSWFEKNWVKGVITAGTIVQTAINVATFLHTMGVFYEDDETHG